MTPLRRLRPSLPVAVGPALGMVLAMGLAMGLGLALVGCGSSSPSATATTSAPPTSSSPSTTASSPASSASATLPPPRGKERYVALGDSYTAAPFVPVTDTTSGCLRSDHSYPELVARRLHLGLDDVACSGATSESMVGVQQTGGGDHPPQFAALNGRTRIVTVGIGGNDYGVFGTVVAVCPQLRASAPHGAPCARKYGGKLRAALTGIRGHVTALVRGVHDRAPHAKVIVVGYPQIVPARGTCPSLLPLADGDVRFANRVVIGLNRALALAARAGGATYVDVARASAGHSICSAHPWVNGRNTDIHRALAYHPFGVEQRAVARLVERAIRRG